jgi:hypothetical protein
VWYGGRLYPSVLALTMAKAWQEAHNEEVGWRREDMFGLD